MVSLKPDHRPTADYLSAIRKMVAKEFPGVTFYFAARRHDHADSEFRPALADRHRDRRRRRARQPRRRRPNSPRSAPRAGHGRRAHPAALRLPRLRHRRRPHQGPAKRADRAGCGGQRAGDAERKLPDRADVLPQLEERRELPGRGAGAAIRHPVSARYPQHPDHRLVWKQGYPRRCRHDLSLAGDGGGGSLQHPPRRRYLRQRAGTRPWRGGAGHHADRRRQPRPPATRQFRDHTGSARDDARRVYQPGRGTGLLDLARLSADRCELPVLA